MPLTRVTLRQFEAFLAIVDLHSIGAAAERLGLTSSAVSQLLAELETELGFPVAEALGPRDAGRRTGEACLIAGAAGSAPLGRET